MRVGVCKSGAVAVSLATALSAVVHATPVKSLDFTIHEEYTSTRAMGMGNAFTAVADDFSALFYNPAALANRTDGQLRMFIRAGADSSSLKLFSEIKTVKSEPSADQTQGYSDLITSHYGDHFYYRIPTIGAVWVRPGWGIAFIPADLSLDIDDHRQVGPMLNLNMYIDSTLAVGYAKKLDWFGKDHVLSWGMTAKAVHRVYVGQELSAGELANGQSVLSTSDADEGLTGDVDMGTYWTPPVPTGTFSFLKYMKPSFALVGRNLLDYGFKTDMHLISKDSGEPPPLIRRFDIGSKWDLPKWWVFDPHFSMDERDIGHPNWSFRKGSHVGMELYWKMYNWWKGHWAVGLNQGYWTAGFGARMAWFQLDLATFGEEVGADSEPKEDRRYLLELALDF
jgi:hypothetical protein